MRCPCRKKSESTTYDDCCMPYHAGTCAAATAEALMRSRYTAFAIEEAAYLIATWHPTTRPARIDFAPGQEWMLLRVQAAHEEGDRATVAFVARSRRSGRVDELHETSRFVREHGLWFYVGGVTA